MDHCRSAEPYLSSRTLAEVSSGESVAGWDMRILQTSSGAFRGASWSLDIEGLQILREDYEGATLNVFGRAPGRTFVFNVPLAVSGEGLFNGARWGWSVCMARGEREFDVLLPPADLLTAVVDADDLVHYVQETEQLDASDWLRNRSLAVSDAGLARSLAAHLRDVMSACFACQVDLSSPERRSALRASVLEELGPLVARQIDPGPCALRDVCRPQVVRAAREFILGHVAEPIRVLDLCRVTRASRRTLQACFQQVLGVTPLAYLRLVRLNGARHALLHATEGMQVRDVVEAWGTWHLGRFSAEYRQVFGERPSDTLRRRH